MTNQPARYHRSRAIMAVIDDLRESHPELTRPLRSEGIRSVLAREGIAVTHGEIAAAAYIDGEEGDLVITLRSGLSARESTKALIHEYGHAKLHLTERGEIVRQLLPCTEGDIRETEADLFAALLWVGPGATMEHQGIARLVTALDRPGETQRSLDLPAAVWPQIGIRLEFTKKGRVRRFYDSEFGWVQVLDVIHTLTGAGWAYLEAGEPLALKRHFIVSTADRRVYRFQRAKESRRPTLKHLERQLRAAVDALVTPRPYAAPCTPSSTTLTPPRGR